MDGLGGEEGRKIRRFEERMFMRLVSKIEKTIKKDWDGNCGGKENNIADQLIRYIYYMVNS